MSTEFRHFVVDQVEGNIAVLEGDGGEVHQLNTSRLPVGTKEGTVLRIGIAADGSIDNTQVELDEEETARRLAQAAELLDELKKRDPGGDVIL